MKPNCAAAIWIVLAFLTGCARLPLIAPVTEPGTREPAPDVSRIFPIGDWRLTHRIEAFPPGGQRQTMIGISRICAERRAVHSVLMTIEGLVLFEADYDGGISVKRAIGFMARGAFAEGLIQDVLMTFFVPDGRLEKTGRLEDGTAVRRYATPDRGTRDILALPQGGYRICHYDKRRRLTRTITFSPAGPDAVQGLSPLIELQAHGPAGYRLRMTLLEAQRLSAPNDQGNPSP